MSGIIFIFCGPIFWAAQSMIAYGFLCAYLQYSLREYDISQSRAAQYSGDVWIWAWPPFSLLAAPILTGFCRHGWQWGVRAGRSAV